MSERVRLIDIAKGLGIIAVVIGHSGAPTLLSYTLYYFHLPLFYFLSGYLWKDKNLDDLKGLIKRKVRSLYLPYVKWQLFFLSIHNLLFYVFVYSESPSNAGSYSFAGTNYMVAQTLYTLEDYIIQFFRRVTLSGGSEQILGASWFIVSLIMTILCFTLISAYAKGKEWKRAVLVVAMFLSGIYLTKNNIQLERFLNMAFVGTGFYYLGYLFKNYGKKVFFSFIVFALAVATLIIFRIKYDIIVEMAAGLYPPIIIFILVSLCGIYSTLYLSKLIENIKFINTFFSHIGKKTLVILFTQFITFKFVTLAYILYKGLPIQQLAHFPVYGYSQYIWIIYTIVGVLAPVFISDAFSKTRTYFKKSVAS